jgi:hypothetical protein
MNTVYVTFKVAVKNHQYSYDATREGEADFEFNGPRDVLGDLDPGSFLMAMFSTALAKFDADNENEDKQE